MDHGFIAHRDDLDDVWVRLGQRHRPVDFGLIRVKILLGVVGRIGPGAGAIDPSAQHYVHLEFGVRLLQLVDGLDHIGCVRQLHVVGANLPDAHGKQDAHVLLQLGQSRLLGAAQSPVSAVGDGGVIGIAKEF